MRPRSVAAASGCTDPHAVGSGPFQVTIDSDDFRMQRRRRWQLAVGRQSGHVRDQGETWSSSSSLLLLFDCFLLWLRILVAAASNDDDCEAARREPHVYRVRDK